MFGVHPDLLGGFNQRFHGVVLDAACVLGMHAW
jgi:hypothetical protein